MDPKLEGNTPWEPTATGGFPSQTPVTRSFDVFFYLRMNKRLGKQRRRRWFVTPSRLLWRHCYVTNIYDNTSLMINFAVQKQHETINQYLIITMHSVGMELPTKLPLLSHTSLHAFGVVTESLTVWHSIYWSVLYYSCFGILLVVQKLA